MSGVHLYPGDTITISKPELNLDGSYRIVKTTKKRKTMEVEIIRQKRTTEKVLEELSTGTRNSFTLTTLVSQFGGGPPDIVLPPARSGIMAMFSEFGYANPSISESMEVSVT